MTFGGFVKRLGKKWDKQEKLNVAKEETEELMQLEIEDFEEDDFDRHLTDVR